jgi:AICAR transformylase/IMP cyclohydrolase PurH
MKSLARPLLFLALLFSGLAAKAQRIDVCESDSVIRVSATSPGNTQVTIERRACKQIIMSEQTYRGLMVAAVQGDSLRKQSMRYIQTVQAEAALRDSIVRVMSGFQKTQESVIRDYQAKLDKSMTLTNDAVKNAEFCADTLKKAKRNNILYGLGGGVAGILVGVLVGALLAN